MTDPHDREPVDQATIDCWRINYGLDKRTPADAARWWTDNLQGRAPAGCVAALGVALDELDALRKDAEQMRAYALQAVAAERERCAAACDAAALEYDVSAKVSAMYSLPTEHGREWLRRAAEWARNMAAAIRAG